jgi:hypothetical protein
MTKHEIWHRGSKSFCDVHRQTDGRFHDQHWQEAPRGEQLPEAIFAEMYRMFLRLEANEPKYDWYYIRYDHEDVVPENENNTTFKLINGEWVKAL